MDLLHVRDVELQVRRIAFTMNSFQSTMSRPDEVKYMPLGDLVQLVAGVGTVSGLLVNRLNVTPLIAR